MLSAKIDCIVMAEYYKNLDEQILGNLCYGDFAPVT